MFEETIPDQLPDEISLLHIDCGFGAPEEQHRQNVLFCLNHAYPRMTKGAIGIIMDYHCTGRTIPGHDSNPATLSQHVTISLKTNLKRFIRFLTEIFHMVFSENPDLSGLF
jgi:hypothetical protein